MKLDKIVDIFLLYCQAEKQLSKHTIAAYSVALNQFIEYLIAEFGEIPTVENIDANAIRPFLGWLHDKNKKINSLRQKISAVKSLFKFVYKKEFSDKNVAKSIIIPKIEKKLPSFLLKNEITELMNSFDGENFINSRNLALIELLYSSGFRISEALGININEIDFKNKQVKVLGKGKKERIVPIGDVALRAIENYCDFRRNINSNTKKLFITVRGNAITPASAWKIVNKSMQKITNAKQKSPHTLRHSFATHLLDNGAEIAAVSQLLGHSNLSTTQIYTHVSIERLKSAYKQAHPKA